MWFPCGVYHFVHTNLIIPPLVKMAGIYPQYFWNAFEIYLFGKMQMWFRREKRLCMCAAAAPLASSVGQHYGLESQQESVCPSSLSQTSTNQQKQMGVCLAGPGTVESTEELKDQELFFLSYLLKEPLTRAHHFRKCFSSISSFSFCPYFSSFLLSFNF